jgi:glycosyltransferase involved in cell wall biosynthesis
MTKLYAIKSEQPFVSVVVTTFNRVLFLRETIESILSQTFADLEVILVDNLSEDGTWDHVRSLNDPRIRYFRNQNNGIIAINRNFGIRQAKGKYIAFCDDDDLWLPDKLKLQVNLLEQNSDIALCYSQAESFIGDKTIAFRMFRRNVYRNHFYHLLQGGFFPNSSVIIHRKIFQEIGLLTEDPKLREDYEMWLRIAKRYQLIGIEKSLIRYRMHTSNVSGNRAAETLRAIRTVKSVAKKLDISRTIILLNICIQYLKYMIYKILMR